MSDLATLLAVARGDRPADLRLTNGRVVNVLTEEVEESDVALSGAWIAGVGPGYDARETLDLGGQFVLPGLIDAHVHIESSLATPPEFARAVVPRGTTTVVSDPHEIANVHGLEGIRYMLAASEGLPLTAFVMASSCVPATHMGTAGAALGAGDLASLDHPRVLGLAELMNFPGAIQGAPEVLEKLAAFRGRVVDGHAPGVTGKALNAYVASGPRSDHECTSPGEAEEKLRRGLWVFFREATNARNLLALLPALSPGSRRRIALCTDDRQPADLLDKGGIDDMLRTLVGEGIDPVQAIGLATLNPAEYFGLHDRGAVAPGRRGDLVVVPSLDELRAAMVFSGGKLVAEGGEALWPRPPHPPPPPTPSMAVREDTLDFSIPKRRGQARVIRAVPDQIVTRAEAATPATADDEVVADTERDLLKIAVVERHTGSGRVGLGLVTGIGLQRGAIAGTVAHDHHNIIVIGADDTSMRSAVQAVAELRGGLAVARGDQVLASLALPVGGLMSEAPVEAIRASLDDVVRSARALGSPLHDPFMAMSFLGLEVIPELKITDLGLVDVEAFEPVDFWLDERRAPAASRDSADVARNSPA
ncbi:MAG: adenine deaminase [Gemmatimonadota bacterium]|nr:adenine deaminase [Gemmatimonadota bacterium]